MEYFIIALKTVVAISLLNVWLRQYNQSTKWRGGDAATIKEEFEVYGLPFWMCYVVGFLKVGFSLTLLASIWYPQIDFIPAIGLSILLMGSIIMHLKIGDPPIKSFPAALFLIMSLVIAFF
jgi:hypothetical protein